MSFFGQCGFQRIGQALIGRTVSRPSGHGDEISVSTINDHYRFGNTFQLPDLQSQPHTAELHKIITAVKTRPQRVIDNRYALGTGLGTTIVQLADPG
jgi:hypothetical protein